MRNTLLALVLALPAVASEPIVHSVDAKDLAAGESDGVAIDLGGRAVLGPRLTTVAPIAEPTVWCAAVDGEGRVYVGTGHEGKVLATGKGASGEARLHFDTPELEVTALATDDDDNLYAATSPDGKVYRITGEGQGEVLFDPEDRYVWALRWDGSDLLVGTGSQARVYRVPPKGDAKTIWTSSERNVTSLVKLHDSLYAGTDDKGKLYRIEPSGAAFAVWDSPLREIASLAAGKDGSLFAVAVDLGRASTLASPLSAPSPPSAPGPHGSPSDEEAPKPPANPASPTGRCEVVKLVPSGSSLGAVQAIWTSSEESVLRLLPDSKGDLLMTTDRTREGRIYRLDRDGTAWVLGRVLEGLVTVLEPLPGGGAVIVTSSPGAIHRLSEDIASRGTLTGKVIDALAAARFGTLTTYAGEPGGSRIVVRARTGNTAEPGPEWTPWSNPLGSGSRIPGPPARYLQWKVEMSAAGQASPWLERLGVASRQENLPPIIESLAVLHPGLVYKSTSLPAEASGFASPSDADLFAQNLPELPEPSGFQAPKRFEFRRGLRTVAWSARDPNGDTLSFDLWYRREGTASPMPLKVDHGQDWYSFDTTSLPDGHYRVEIRASDGPSNDPAEAKVVTRTSMAFEVDNTPPRVQASRDEGTLMLRATDGSGLGRAYLSVSSGPWRPLSPEDGVTDGMEEVFRIALADLELPGKSGAVILFKVFDHSGNVGSASIEVPPR